MELVMKHTKKGLMYDRSTVEVQGASLPVEWKSEMDLVINGGGSVKVVGLVRGAGYEGVEKLVYTVSAPDVYQLAHEIILPEWIYKLYVNGRRIMNPERYLKRKGVPV